MIHTDVESENQGALTKNIRLGAFELWERRVSSINKRLAKRGAPVISYTVSDPYMVPEPRLPDWHTFYDPKDTINRPHVEITLEVEPVNVGGHRPIAILEYHHSEPFIRAWPGEELNIEAPATPHCDYCGKQRRRQSIVVLEQIDAPGSRYYVGKSCVKDFIGYDPTSMLSAAEWVIEAYLYRSDDSEEDREERNPAGGRGKGSHDIAEILLWSVAAIREFGWRGAKYEEGITTAGIVGEAMYPTPRKFRDAPPPPKPEITAEDKTAATEALEYVRSIENPSGDYVRNIATLARDGYCTHKEFQLAVSIARFVQNETEKEKERAERRQQAEERNAGRRTSSDHVGALKERLTFPSATLESVRVIASEGPYGPTSTDLLKFVTPEGDQLCWFSSSANDYSGEVGKVVKLVGTVKAHKEFQGVKETQLTRCVVTVVA